MRATKPAPWPAHLATDPSCRPIRCGQSLRLDRKTYRRRNEVERLFRRLKAYRRVFTRFDKLDVMFTAFIRLALIFDALR